MSNYGITVDTGGGAGRAMREMDLAAFFHNAGVVEAALESMKGSARALGAGLQGAARGLIRMGEGARGVLSALMDSRNVVDGLQTGMERLSSYSRSWWRSFARTLSALSANAAYLRDSLAAMAAPLLNALTPAIEAVTDRFVGLFNLLNQFFARLGGASTYVAAKRASGGINAVGSAASGASDQVKALRRQLADFDELNVLFAPQDSSGGSGGGGSGGGGTGVLFEELPVEGGLAAFVDSLKAAFEASDWQALGALIGGKVNALVESVDWAGLGQKLGFYLNGAIQTACSLLDTVNFRNIGGRVAELLNNALSEIDFSTLGATVALFFSSFAETLAGFIEGFDWAQFAGKLADGVNGFVSKLGEKLDGIDWAGLALKLTQGLNIFVADTDWANAGEALGGRVNDLLAILGTAAASFDWKSAGEALATAANNMVRKVDWEALSKWLNDTLQGVLDFGVAFLRGFDAAGFADSVGKALAKVDWDAVSQKLWTLFKLALEKLGSFFGTLLFGGSADVKLNLGLLKDGWTSIAAWLGIESPMSALIGLVKSGWTSIADFIGTVVSVGVKLLSTPASGSSTLTGVFGSFFSVVSKLTGASSDSNTLAGVYGSSFDTKSRLTGAETEGAKTLEEIYGDFSTHSILKGKETAGAKTLAEIYGDFNTHSILKGKETEGAKTLTEIYGNFKTKSRLTGKEKGTNSLTDVYGKSFEVKAKLSSTIEGLSNFVNTVANKLKSALESIWKTITGAATGGVITNGGLLRRFASGGVINGGMARYLSGVPHYAGGTTRAHGTVFVAGEAGPEIMGHINGRTEILNKSQLAQTMYSAVLSAMSQSVSALGTFLSGQMANCANAIVAAIGNAGSLAGVANISYHAPVMASGTVLPYDVAAQIARTGMDIQNTLDANNEDLIQTIISVAGQIVAAVQARGSGEQATGSRNGGGQTAQQLIDDINRRARMFGSSPLLD